MKKHLQDYFIPHEGNDYKPHSLQKAALVGMTVLVVMTFTAANLQALLWVSSDWLVSAVLPSVIVDLTNVERQEQALVSLKRNVVLDRAAQMKAEHMAQNQYFSHYSPDGVSPWYWFSKANYNFVHAGENLAIHFTDSSDVVDAWMDSPTHRDNILNGNYREIGVGTATGTYEGFDTVYVVQLFGTPAFVPEPTVVTAPEPAAAPLVAGDETVLTEAVSTAEPTEVLAEAVKIFENIAVSEPPAAVVTQGETKAESETLEFAPTSTEVAEVRTNEAGVVVISDHLSTSTGGVPARIETDSAAPANQTWLGSIATQPHLVMQILYAVIASFVLLCLVLAVVIEWRRQHPIQLAYSLALLVLMFGLYQLHFYLSAGAVVV